MGRNQVIVRHQETSGMLEYYQNEVVKNKMIKVYSDGNRGIHIGDGYKDIPRQSGKCHCMC